MEKVVKLLSCLPLCHTSKELHQGIEILHAALCWRAHSIIGQLYDIEVNHMQVYYNMVTVSSGVTPVCFGGQLEIMCAINLTGMLLRWNFSLILWKQHDTYWIHTYNHSFDLSQKVKSYHILDCQFCSGQFFWGSLLKTVCHLCLDYWLIW